jgi:TonB family protein
MQRQSNGDVKPERMPEEAAMGNLIAVKEPSYPEEAKKRHVAGKVTLKILIDTKGTVKEAEALSGDLLLLEETLQAVKQWKFSPFRFGVYLDNAKPREVDTTATVEYKDGDPPFIVTPKPQRHIMRLSPGVMDGMLIRRIDPRYPDEAKAGHIEGDVVLRATIDKNGNVADLKPVQGDAMLTDAAMKAASQWKYRPFLLNGKPVEVETTITIRFHM